MPPLDNPQRAAPALAGGIGQPAPVRDRRRLPVAGPLLVGPAVLAATAYIGPGNFRDEHRRREPLRLPAAW